MDSILNFIFLAILFAVCISWLSTMIVIVKQRTAAVIEVFGKFSCVKEAGLNFKAPWPIASVANVVDLQIMQLTPDVTVKSSDNAFLSIPVKLQYKVIESKIKEANYELDNPQEQIKSYVLNMVRSKSSEYTMDELFSTKDSFDTEVKNSLNNKFSPYGYEVVDLLIDDPQPSEELKVEFNNVLAAQRKKDAAKNEAEALKIKMVGEATAEKESLVLKGEAFTAYRAKIASGNKEAMDIFLGRAEYVEGEDGKLTYKEIPTDKRRELNLSEKDILNFFEGVDQREAIRSVGKHQGNVIISTNPTHGGNQSTEELVALIKSLTNKA